ncbi:MAG: Maf family protein [Gammaproteobacteria bacterium]
MNQELICLASVSPRRRQLLEQIGVAFEVRPADIDESSLCHETPRQFVHRVALAKAEHSAKLHRRSKDQIILAADTAVVLDGNIFGKPADNDEACRMLQALSGRTHQVMTAVAVVRSGTRLCETSVSDVTFGDLTSEQIDSYVATGEPADKAGAYGIQGLGAVFVSRLEGSFSGVMGLPLFETAVLLAQFGVPVLCPVAGDCTE